MLPNRYILPPFKKRTTDHVTLRYNISRGFIVLYATCFRLRLRGILLLMARSHKEDYERLEA